MEIRCEECSIIFEANVWEDGNCPRCNTEFYWDSIYIGDVYGDDIFAVFNIKMANKNSSPN